MNTQNKEEHINRAWLINIIIWSGLQVFMIALLITPLLLEEHFNGIIDINFNHEKLAKNLIIYIAFGLFAHFGFYILLGNLSLKSLLKKDHLKEAIKVTRNQTIFSMLFLYVLLFPIIIAFMAGFGSMETFVISIFPVTWGIFMFPKKHHINRHINTIDNYQKYYKPKKGAKLLDASESEQTIVRLKLKKLQFAWGIISSFIIALILMVCLNTDNLIGKNENSSAELKSWLYNLIFTISILALTFFIRNRMFDSVDSDTETNNKVPLFKIFKIYRKSIFYALLLCLTALLFSLFSIRMSDPKDIIYYYYSLTLIFVTLFFHFPREKQLNKISNRISEQMRYE